MIEHDENDFEHGIKAKFEKLDGMIKIPEIPDAQNIFEKADSRKNIFSFKKYSKYAAIAAAVVLICVGAPIMADALGVEPPFESEKSSLFATNETAQDSEMNIESELIGEDVTQDEGVMDVVGNYEGPKTSEPSEDSDNLYRALNDFFKSSRYDGLESSNSKSELESNAAEFGIIEDKLNKKRSIEIAVEEDSVSVRLFDDTLDGEIICAFWVEGEYKNSSLNNDVYTIKLEKRIEQDEFESGYYLPMAGDAENGNYMISEQNILISEEVTEGIIAIVVEINIATGEYEIYASLI